MNTTLIPAMSDLALITTNEGRVNSWLASSVSPELDSDSFATANSSSLDDLTITLAAKNIPKELLPKARARFDRQMKHLEQKHGAKWPEHRAWLVEYLNEELREHLAKREVSHDPD